MINYELDRTRCDTCKYSVHNTCSPFNCKICTNLVKIKNNNLPKPCNICYRCKCMLEAKGKKCKFYKEYKGE